VVAAGQLTHDDLGHCRPPVGHLMTGRERLATGFPVPAIYRQLAYFFKDDGGQNGLARL